MWGKTDTKITLSRNERLEVDIASIVRLAGEAVPPFVRLNLGYKDLEKRVISTDMDGMLVFTEDLLESILRTEIDSRYDTAVGDFSWMWSKYKED